MKIFLFIESLASGGAERVTVLLAEHWVALGHEVVVVTMRSQEYDFYSLDPLISRISFGSSETGLFGGLVSLIRGLHGLRQALKCHKPDIMVAMLTSSVVIGILASMRLSVRVFGSERNYPPRKKVNPFWAFFRRAIYRFAAGHIAQTEKTAVWLERFTRARNIRVIPNPVGWPIRAYGPKIFPDDLVLADRRVLLAIGTKPYQKGFDLLLEAFSRLASCYPDWDLVILGIDHGSRSSTGGSRSMIALAENFGIADRLTLPGKVGNAADWYRRADIFVLSSRYEGMPNVLLEAMASGCPSIAFDCDTGPGEIIQDQVNGILVPAEDIQALCDGLISLMEDESLRAQYGEKGKWVREKFSEREIIALWNEAIGLTTPRS